MVPLTNNCESLLVLIRLVRTARLSCRLSAPTAMTYRLKNSSHAITSPALPTIPGASDTYRRYPLSSRDFRRGRHFDEHSKRRIANHSLFVQGPLDGKEIMRSNNGHRLERNRKFVDSPLGGSRIRTIGSAGGGRHPRNIGSRSRRPVGVQGVKQVT